MNHLANGAFAALLFGTLASCADPAGPTGAAMTAGVGGTVAGASSSTGGAPGAGTSGAAMPAGGGSAGTSGGGATSAGGGGQPGANGGSGGALGTAGMGGATAQDPPRLVPAQGALFGAFVQREGASSYGNIAPAETQLGRKLAINHRFFGWNDDWVGEVSADAAAGRIALISWEPHGTSLDAIIAGTDDALITSRANAAKATGAPIFMRWAHEMNGDWYPWGGANNGGSGTGPQKYIAAWRHLHDVFQAAGASNVLWVWCFNVGSSPDEPWNAPSAYYPGEDYVDWVAFDGYNWGTTQTWSSWRSFSSFAATAYEQSVGWNKPIMVPETGVTELGGDKSAWVTDMQAAFKNTFPKIKALVYFDTIDTTNNVDWTMNSSANALQAFAGLASDPYFNP